MEGGKERITFQSAQDWDDVTTVWISNLDGLNVGKVNTKCAKSKKL